jgi:hypothetical protein
MLVSGYRVCGNSSGERPPVGEVSGASAASAVTRRRVVGNPVGNHLLLGVLPQVPTALPHHYSNGAVEQALTAIRSFIAQGAFCCRNAKRTNAMLELVRLNRQENAARYAADIRRYLYVGRRLRSQRQNLGPRGSPEPALMV